MSEPIKHAVKYIRWACDCGNMPPSVEVGTTSDGCLIVRWYCPKCEAWITARVKLTKLISSLPAIPKQKLLAAPPLDNGFNKEDIDLLGAMHIKLGEQDCDPGDCQ